LKGKEKKKKKKKRFRFVDYFRSRLMSKEKKVK